MSFYEFGLRTHNLVTNLTPINKDSLYPEFVFLLKERRKYEPTIQNVFMKVMEKRISNNVAYADWELSLNLL